MTFSDQGCQWFFKITWSKTSKELFNEYKIISEKYTSKCPHVIVFAGIFEISEIDF